MNASTFTIFMHGDVKVMGTVKAPFQQNGPINEIYCQKQNPDDLTDILQRRLQLRWVGERSLFRQDDEPKDHREEVGRNQTFRIL